MSMTQFDFPPPQAHTRATGRYSGGGFDCVAEVQRICRHFAPNVACNLIYNPVSMKILIVIILMSMMLAY